MDRKQMCIANIKYKRPTQNEQKGMKNMLKYLTYRDGRDGYVQQVSGKERWVDHGLGSSVTGIANQCERYQSDHVLLFSLVVNPNPDLVAMIPHEKRERFLRQLTDNTVNDFFDERGIDTGVEYSWVMHHRMTDDGEAPGRHDPHTHIILPGTYYDADEGRRVPLFFSRNKSVNHIEMLHSVNQHHMEQLMDRFAGPDWEQRYDALAQQRLEQLEVVEEQPHGYHVEEDGTTRQFWCGTRQFAKDDCAIGYYIEAENPHTEQTEIQFRPISKGLNAEYAQKLSAKLGNMLQEQTDEHQLFIYIETVKGLLKDDEELDLPDVQTRPISNDNNLSIDL